MAWPDGHGYHCHLLPQAPLRTILLHTSLCYHIPCFCHHSRLELLVWYNMHSRIFIVVGNAIIRLFSMHHWWYNDGILDVDVSMMAVMISYLFDVGTMLPGVPFCGYLTVAYVWRADHDQHRVLTWSMTRQRMWYDCRNCTSHTYFMMGFRLTSRLP